MEEDGRWDCGEHTAWRSPLGQLRWLDSDGRWGQELGPGQGSSIGWTQIETPRQLACEKRMRWNEKGSMYAQRCTRSTCTVPENDVEVIVPDPIGPARAALAAAAPAVGRGVLLLAWRQCTGTQRKLSTRRKDARNNEPGCRAYAEAGRVTPYSLWPRRRTAAGRCPSRDWPWAPCPGA